MSTSHPSAAFYTRTSCLRPIGPRTLEGQWEDLWARARGDGVKLPPESIFIDEGYSGAELLRPALKRLRDVAATGALDRLYVPSPDRLARDLAQQIVLIGELHRARVKVVFLNHDEACLALPGRSRS